jgi:hypothetical protein
MKKLLASIALACITGLSPVLAQERTWTVTVLAAPGSGDHRMIMALAPVAAKDNVKFDIKFNQGCRSVVEDLAKSPDPALAVTPGPLYYPGRKDTECFFPEDSAQQLHFIGVMESSINWCSVPGQSYSLKDLQSGRSIRVAVGKDSAPYLQRMVETMGAKKQVRVLIYRGTGDIIRASTAGDIDMWFSASAIRQQPGVHCVGASTRKNVFNLPFLGDVINRPQQFPEVSDVVALASYRDRLSAQDQQQLRKWLNSEEFQSWRRSNRVQSIDFDSAAVEKKLRQWSEVLGQR